MNQNVQYGLYLLQKGRSDQCVLKELLQLLKVQNPGKNVQFAYIEAKSSLIPHISLWENLQVAIGGDSWRDFQDHLEPEWKALAQLIRDPHLVVSDASDWERLTVSLLKGLVTESPNLLVDMNEDLHSAFNLQNFKKILLKIADRREIFLASSNPSLWLDSCHSLVSRQGYEFRIEATQGLISRKFGT
jgi:hypothetical protein